MLETANIYVEYLTVWNWLKVILPALRLYAREQSGRQCRCYIFDSTPVALWLARHWGRIEGFLVEKIDFQIADVKDEQGLSGLSWVCHKNPVEIQRMILNNPDFISFTGGLDPHSFAKAYLAKLPVIYYSLIGPQKYSETGHVAFMIQIVHWHQRRLGHHSLRVDLYVIPRLWMKELQEYAKSYGGRLCALGPVKLWRWKWAEYKSRLSNVNLNLIKALVRHKIFEFSVKQGRVENKFYFKTDIVRMLTESYGQFNLDDPQCHSDVFYADEKALRLKDILLYFNSVTDPIDEKKYALLQKHDLAAVALTPQSCLVDPALVPVFRADAKVSIDVPSYPAKASREIKSLAVSLAHYNKLRSYWRQFLQRYNIKLYTSWLNCEANTMAIADALTDVGGISSIYQRSYKPGVSPQLAVGTDIIFGFSNRDCELQAGSGSQFRYYVTVGYLGDNRFDVLRPRASQIRNQLLTHGAKHIIAYFDENTLDDGRWFHGHKMAQDNYRFLLEKLLFNSELGLVLKPKVPGTLRRRLGDINRLLVEAEKTGRCFMFGEGSIFGSYPPAAAALAADIAIHDQLACGTAGLEAALAGIPTLLIDLEGWSFSPLYGLGDHVVFTDRDSAWRACEAYFKDPLAHPRAGNWSSMINEFDPFHDGRAAQRMSRYLKDLLEGLRAGEKPTEVMEKVAERYARQWGKDKVQRGPRYDVHLSVGESLNRKEVRL